jgi:hypothetical protein
MLRENVDAYSGQGLITPRLENARESFFNAVYLYSVECMPPLTSAAYQPFYHESLG